MHFTENTVADAWRFEARKGMLVQPADPWKHLEPFVNALRLFSGVAAC